MTESQGRSHWTCPKCERLFTIPVGMHLILCPDCQKAALVPAQSAQPRNDWYLQLRFEPEPRGPLPLRAVQRLYRQGTLSREDFARRGVNGDQMEVESFPEIWSQKDVPPIHVYTAPTVIRQGFGVTEYLPMVSARRVYGINMLAEWFADGADWTGGRVTRYEQAAANIEQELIEDLRVAAAERGGNAVVDFRMQFGEFSGKDKFMLWGIAHGTPVVLSDGSE